MKVQIQYDSVNMKRKNMHKQCYILFRDIHVLVKYEEMHGTNGCPIQVSLMHSGMEKERHTGPP